jgi:hypothetical protein
LYSWAKDNANAARFATVLTLLSNCYAGIDVGYAQAAKFAFAENIAQICVYAFGFDDFQPANAALVFAN